MDQFIGVDCEDISRFEDILLDKKLLNNIFTEKEIKYCMGRADPKKHFAVRFAGKEAVLKALNASGREISIEQIEILNSEKGVPIVNIKRDGLESIDVKLSLSHSRDMAIAFAIVMEL